MTGNRALVLARILALVLAASLLSGCDGGPGRVALEVPRGYAPVVERMVDGRLVRFGPFKGYYLRPTNPDDLDRLEFVCFNEDGWYASDMPVNARLYEGAAVFARLPDDARAPAEGGRIRPVFFPDAPKAWTDTRPQEPPGFQHFHTAYDGTGAARCGYWLRHVAVAAFTYDMGGRVGPDSPLYHRVSPGPDLGFARIVEFDTGKPGAFR